MIGLHWLLVGPEGLLHHRPRPGRAPAHHRLPPGPDALLRGRGGEGARLRLARKQRNLQPGVTREQAREWLIDAFTRSLPVAEASGVTLCLEPLPPPECDFIRTTTEALDVIRRHRPPQPAPDPGRQEHVPASRTSPGRRCRTSSGASPPTSPTSRPTTPTWATLARARSTSSPSSAPCARWATTTTSPWRSSTSRRGPRRSPARASTTSARPRPGRGAPPPGASRRVRRGRAGGVESMIEPMEVLVKAGNHDRDGLPGVGAAAHPQAPASRTTA